MGKDLFYQRFASDRADTLRMIRDTPEIPPFEGMIGPVLSDQLLVHSNVYEILYKVENRNIMHPIYYFKDKTKTTDYKQRLSYHLHRVSRKFVFEVSKNFTNLHGCGLFSYVALLANARSNYIKELTTVYAWLNGKEKYYKKILNVKTDKELFRQLDILKEAGLIDYQKLDNGSMTVFLLEGYLNVYAKKPPKKKIIGQYAAIKKHTGYFFVNEVNIRELIASAGFYSEADALVDFWLNTIFNDADFELSTTPIVYLKDNREDPELNVNVTTAQLSKRWSCSYGRVNKLLKKMEELEFIKTYIFPNIGTVIFNKAYIDFFATDYKFKAKEDEYKTYKHFYRKKAFIKYIIALYKQRLNYSSKQEFWLEVVRFFKSVKINPYGQVGRRTKKPFFKRILDLLSLFDFSSKSQDPLVESVLANFLRLVKGNFLRNIYIY